MVVVPHGVVPVSKTPLLAAPVGLLAAIAVDPPWQPSSLCGELTCGDGALRQPPIPIALSCLSLIQLCFDNMQLHV